MFRRVFTLLLALGFASPWCCCFGTAAVAAETAPPMTCCGEPLDPAGDADRGQPHDCPHAVQRDHQVKDTLDLAVGLVDRPLLTVLAWDAFESGAADTSLGLPAEIAQAPPDGAAARCARLAVFLL